MILVPFIQSNHVRVNAFAGQSSPNNLIIRLMNEKLLVPSLKDGLAQSARPFSLRRIGISRFMLHPSLKSVLKRMAKSRILTFHDLLSHLRLICLEDHTLWLLLLHNEL